MTEIYHITHLQNLESIILHGGLWCDRERLRRKLASVGIAHNHIKDRRARRAVPTCKGGTLADYVPFYFGPRSPMLFAIHRGLVPQYREGQGGIVHLVSTVEQVLAENLAFTFTEGHAEMAYSSFFEKTEDLCKIDWSVMKTNYWNDTVSEPDRKRKRQAELLTYSFFPWKAFSSIGVIDSETASRVRKIIQAANHQPAVGVNRGWYY